MYNNSIKEDEVSVLILRLEQNRPAVKELEGGIAETEEQARAMLQASIDDGSALKKLAEFVEAQGGDSAAATRFVLIHSELTSGDRSAST